MSAAASNGRAGSGGMVGRESLGWARGRARERLPLAGAEVAWVGRQIVHPQARAIMVIALVKQCAATIDSPQTILTKFASTNRVSYGRRNHAQFI